MLAEVRRFFQKRGVLEVETPLLCHTSGTDPNLHPFVTDFHLPGRPEGIPLYLQTSPEFAMKRLLASDSGPIYQICKAFRNEENGRHHNPEFTILEWYRPSFRLADLIEEIDALLTRLFTGKRKLAPTERWAYPELFTSLVGADPITASLDRLADAACQRGLPEASTLCGDNRSIWLDLLFSHVVQPQLGRGRACFVYDYPACLPSLARRKPDRPEVVERVELFLDGLELGNGFRELTDPNEQEQRFDTDLAHRRQSGLLMPPKDTRLLAALGDGLPDSSGVALGLDRILMLQLGATSIEEVLAFPVGRA